MKKLGFLLIIMLFFLCSMQTTRAYEYNGDAGDSSAAPGTGGCENYKGKLCQYNTKNDVGLRFTLVYCYNNGFCEKVTNLNGKNIRSIDIWKTPLYLSANRFTYVGDSKVESGGGLKKGGYSYYAAGTTNWSTGVYTPNYEVLLLNMFNNVTSSDSSSFYNTYTTNQEVPISHMDSILSAMGGANTSDLKAEASSKLHLTSKECTKDTCYGYRLFIEPIFSWVKVIATNNKGQITEREDYLLTPSEIARLIPKSEIAGGHDYRLWIESKSLFTTKYDVGYTAPNGITNPGIHQGYTYDKDIRNHLNNKIGYGLNIVDVPAKPDEQNCAAVDRYNPTVYDMTYEQLSKIGNLTYNDAGAKVSPIWYWNNCSCGIVYNYYSDKTAGKDMKELTKNNINSLFSTGYFDGIVQSIIPGTVNQKWTMAKYLERGCKYKTNTFEDGLTCTDVINYYSGLGKDLANMTVSQLKKVDFSLFNNAYKDKITTPWSADRYIEEGCPYDKTNCTPKYNLYENGSVGTCYKGSLEYYDSENWEECIFTNAENDITNTTTNYKDDTLSNNYCEVYCREDLTVNFSKDIIVVGAGKNFTWNNHYILGSRTCKTKPKSINWIKFDNDLKNANDTVRNNYIDWQLEKLKADAISNAKVTSSNHTTSADGCGDGVTCGKDEVGCEPKKETYKCSCGGCDPYTVCSYNPKSSVTFMGKTITINSWSESHSGHNASCSSALSFVNSKTNVSSKETAYNSSLNLANGIISTMQSCYDSNAWDSKIYNLDPKVSVSYGDTNYSYLGDMKKTINYGKIETVLNCKKQKVYKITGCSGSSCSGTNVDMENCTSVEMKKGATANFEIPSNVFKYIIKDNHLSIHEDEFNTYKNMYEAAGKTFNYVNVGYGNFPVAYKTPNGYYGANYDKGDLSLKFSDLGHKVGNEQTKIDNLLSQVDSETKYGDYKCEFKVVDGLIPEDKGEEKGINVIYRPIDLNNPFPDIDGTGRKQGSNWCGSEDCSMDSYNVKTYITNNRGVTTEDIYKEKPMYTFVLTPSLIKEIRKYNNENSYAEYYGTYSGKTYNFSCSGNSKCISEYLTELINLTSATGSCTTNRKDEFDSCRYK